MLAVVFFSSSCRKVVVPGIKGHIYDKETLEPVQKVKLIFCFIYRTGNSIVINEEVVSDSLGYFEIPPYEKSEFFLPTLESDNLSLCTDCHIMVEKEGFAPDSIFIEEIKYKNNYFILDSLSFIPKEIEQN